MRQWDHCKFTQLCILAGCDYLPSPKGIGFKTAYTLVYKFNNIVEILDNYKKDIGIENYEERFMCAYTAFKFSRVFCP